MAAGRLVTMSVLAEAERFGFWSGWRESNPYSRLGKPVLCH